MHHSNTCMNTVSVLPLFWKATQAIIYSVSKKLHLIYDSCRWRQIYSTYFSGKDQLVKGFSSSVTNKTVQKKSLYEDMLLKACFG